MKRDFELVSPTSPEIQLNLTGIRQLLKEELEPITDDINKIKESLHFNSEKLDEIATLNVRVLQLEKKYDTLNEVLAKYEQKNLELEDKILKMESYSRRSNLKFINVANGTADSSDPENCEKLISDLCFQLNIPLPEYSIERAHRLGKIASSPIIVKFYHYKIRQKVFAERERFKEKGITVVEDYPREILKRRKTFTPTLQAAYKSAKYKARLVADKLLLNGKLYTTKDLDKLPEDLKPSVLTTVSHGNSVAFFTSHSALSNHYSCTFNQDGYIFSSSEQYFMFKKAKYFHDEVTAAAILKSSDPLEAKSLGKKVQNFDAESWKAVRYIYMRTALTAKFTQNEKLKGFLKATGKKTLIEANAFDKFWGVGLSLGDKNL